MSDNENISVKIVILGEPAVGKTTLRINYIGNKMEGDYLMTLGADLSKDTIPISDKITLEAQIWDIAGQENFTPIIGDYLQGAQGAILVYDMTRSYTFDKITEWLEKLHKANPELDRNIPFIIVGNKADLENFYDYDEEKVEEFVSYLNRHQLYSKTEVKHINTSAKTGYAVKKAFIELGKTIVRNFLELGREVDGAKDLFDDLEEDDEEEYPTPELEVDEDEHLVRPSDILKKSSPADESAMTTPEPTQTSGQQDPVSEDVETEDEPERVEPLTPSFSIPDSATEEPVESSSDIDEGFKGEDDVSQEKAEPLTPSFSVPDIEDEESGEVSPEIDQGLEEDPSTTPLSAIPDEDDTSQQETHHDNADSLSQKSGTDAGSSPDVSTQQEEARSIVDSPHFGDSTEPLTSESIEDDDQDQLEEISTAPVAPKEEDIVADSEENDTKLKPRVGSSSTFPPSTATSSEVPQDQVVSEEPGSISAPTPVQSGDEEMIEISEDSDDAEIEPRVGSTSTAPLNEEQSVESAKSDDMSVFGDGEQKSPSEESTRSQASRSPKEEQDISQTESGDDGEERLVKPSEFLRRQREAKEAKEKNDRMTQNDNS